MAANKLADYGTQWYADVSNVNALGNYLYREHHFTAKELLAYYEKPWKWGDEWEEYQDSLRADAEEAEKKVYATPDETTGHYVEGAGL